jgi:hypothetical protein
MTHVMDDEQQVQPARAPSFPITPQLPRAGRPTKLTSEVQAKIVQAVKNGSFFEPAAIAAGVSKEAMREWVIRGQSDLQLGRNTVYRQFITVLAQAQADNETRLAGILSKGGEGKFPDWRAQAFVLERRHKERWSLPKEQQSQGITLQLSNEQIASLVDALRIGAATNVTPQSIQEDTPQQVVVTKENV